VGEGDEQGEAVTKEELAGRLDGREYRAEITDHEEKLAKEAGLVVLFGASDDLAEFVGAIEDEEGAYDGGSGTELYLVDGKVFKEPDCQCEWAEAAKVGALSRGQKILARYGQEGWTYETEIPHATFNVMEDGELYCRGIVFALSSVK
jgi:hypothetical protein